MQTITVLPGSGKDGTCEAFTSIELQRGKLYTIVGSTGSGKIAFHQRYRATCWWRFHYA